MKIKTKVCTVVMSIMILAIVSMVVIMVLGLRMSIQSDIGLFEAREIELHKKIIKSQVDVAISIIDNHERGSRTIEEEKEHVLEIIKDIRYDNGNGYIWIVTSSIPPYMIMHPINSGLDGLLVNQGDVVTYNSEDQNVFAQMVIMCQLNGSAYVEYNWVRPYTSEVDTKLAYVREYKKYQWIVGSGVYTDDIEKEVTNRIKTINKQIKNLALIGLVAAIVLCVIFAEVLNIVITKLLDK